MAIKLVNPKLRVLFSTSQNKTYTVAGATILLSILMIFVVIRPSVSRIFTQISENKQRRVVLTQMDEKLSNLQALIAAEVEQKENIVIFNNELLPSYRREDEFIANLSKGANDIGVALTSIGVIEDSNINQALVLPDGIKSYLLYSSIQGERQEIENYLEFLESFPREISVESFSIARVSSDELRTNGLENSFRADIKARVFYWEKTTTAK